MRARLSGMAALGLAVVVLTAGSMSDAYSQQPPIYGSQLMTEQERAEYRSRMRTATSEQEREQIRLQHHAQMQKRAAELGIELPDAPPMTGMGRGTGQGQGMGAGHGGKMRQGARNGRGN
jgi:hypothetical protein